MTPKSLIEPARHAGTALLRSQTDSRLVDLTREGNERAFEAIVQRYRRPLLRYCARLLSPSRAEDAVQQAFLSAHRAIHAGDADLNLRPWLYRIAHNMSLNLLRQNGFDHEQMSEEIDGVETPPQAFERGERLRTVVAAVQELPERQRSAIVLQALEGRSYDEIADELGVSDGAVRQLLNRARNTLREAAAAITPTGLITRFASNGGEATVAERVAQVVTSAGGGALVVKAGATLVVVGAVAGSAATGALPGGGDHHRAKGPSAAANAASTATPAGAQVPAGAHSSDVVLTSRGSGSSSLGVSGGGSSHSGSSTRGGGSNLSPASPGDQSHHGGSSDNHSGSGGDHSGSGDSGGSSGSGDSGTKADDHSGSGSGGDSSGSSDHSGSSDDSAPPQADSSSGSGSSGSSGSGKGSGSGSDDPTVTTPVETGSGKGRAGSSGGSDSFPDTSDDPADPSGKSASSN